MGCSNCGASMCDCPPWAGNSMGQDYAGLAQPVYGRNREASPPESWDKKIASLVASKYVTWVAKECYHRFEFNDPFVYTAKLFKNKWGAEETTRIFKKERATIEDAVHQYFTTEDSFLKKLKKALR